MQTVLAAHPCTSAQDRAKEHPPPKSSPSVPTRSLLRDGPLRSRNLSPVCREWAHTNPEAGSQDRLGLRFQDYGKESRHYGVWLEGWTTTQI